MNHMELATLDEWQHDHPERWARIEGTLTRNELRTLKFLKRVSYMRSQVRIAAIMAPAR